MNDVGTRPDRVGERPRRVVNVPESAVVWMKRRPFAVGKQPPDLAADSRLPVGVDDDIMAAVDQRFGEMSDEQFSSAVRTRRDRNEWRRYDGDLHVSIDSFPIAATC
jgi:hypothetical protein